MNNRPCPLCHEKKSHPKYNVEDFRIARCQSCGFVYLTNPPNAESDVQKYDDYFRSADLLAYTPNSTDTNIRQAWRINEKRIVWIQKNVGAGKMLDIGCGRGFFLQHAQAAGFDVEGLEISRLAARYASEHFGLNVRICNLDQEINFEGSYNIITMWHVLEHFHNPRTVLENVWTLLAPGGFLFVEVPNQRSLFFQLSPPAKKWRGGNHPTYHRSFFTRTTLHNLLDSTGFTNKQDSHIVYPVGKSKAAHFIKKILNTCYRDSFLNIAAIK